MYPYILCFCGRALDMYLAFKEMRKDLLVKEYEALGIDVDPSLLAITESIQVDLSDVFEQLCVRMDCCKVRLVTLVEFRDFY